MKEFYKRFTENVKLESYPSPMMCLKALEELGELAEVMHWITGYKPNDKTEEEIKYGIAEEVCDVINCVMTVAHKEGIDAELLNEVFEAKLKKWKNNAIRKK